MVWTVATSIVSNLMGFGSGWPSWCPCALPAWCPFGNSVAETSFEEQLVRMDGLRASQQESLLRHHRKALHNTRSLPMTMLSGYGAGARPPTRTAVGWLKIAGDESDVVGGEGAWQPTWAEACDDLCLSSWQGFWVAVFKLICWHWSQPVVYYWVFFVYFCTLSPDQQLAGSIIAARETIYVISTVIALIKCPSFLLLDLSTVWAEEQGHVRILHVAMYLLTPHIFVSVCIVHNNDKLRKIFLPLTFCEIIADFASCFALGALLTPGSNPPTALVIGYAITSDTFPGEA